MGRLCFIAGLPRFEVIPMRKLSFIFLALALVLSLLPVVAVSAPARAAKPDIVVYPIPPYVKTPPFIGGCVSDADGDAIVRVEVMLKCITDGNYWDGSDWPLSSTPYYNDAAAIDGDFNSPFELWGYSPWPAAGPIPTPTPPAYVNGKQYAVLQVRAADDNSEEEVESPETTTFWYDTAPPDIEVFSPGVADDLDEISGSICDGTSPVVDVKVVIQRDLDNYYLNLDAKIWQDCKAWNDAAAEDGAFNENSENWELDTSDVPWYDGVTYTVWAMASDAAGNSAEPTATADVEEYECNRYSPPGDELVIDMNGAGAWGPYFVSAPLIYGSASADSPKTITAVMVKILRDHDGRWWDGTDWVAPPSEFIDAQASDLDGFNEDVEDWYYTCPPPSPTPTPITWEEGLSYTLTAMVQDSSTTVQSANDIEEFTIDTVDPVADVMAIATSTTAPSSIEGGASDTAPGEVASVQVQVERAVGTPVVTDYWNGHVWQGDEVWLYSAVTVDTYPSYDWVLNTDPTWDAGSAYTISAKAVDKAGNCGETASKTFVCTGLPPYVPPTHTPQVAIVAPAKVNEDGSFIAEVQLSYAVDFAYAQYNIEYDPAVIEVSDVSDGSKGSTVIPVTDWDLVPAGTQGVVSVTSDVVGTTGLSGNMVLAEIEFDVVGDPGDKSDLDFDPANRELLDDDDDEIEADWIDDSVEVKAVSAGLTPSPTPTPSASPTPTPSATPTTQVVIDVATAKVDADGNFSAKVRLYLAENFDTAQYRIQYDPAVIEVTDVSDGVKGAKIVDVTSWSLVPADTQGKLSVVNDVAGTTGLSGELVLANIDFHVVGAAGTESDIEFIEAHCKLFDNGVPNASEIEAGWKDDSVEVKAAAATATPTSNATATPTATPTPGEGGGTPGWVWPMVGILIALTLVFIGLALYKAGYLAKLGQMWGATEEDFLVDDMSDEDLYDAMYGGEEEEEL
jgi:hypothetical protein